MWDDRLDREVIQYIPFLIMYFYILLSAHSDKRLCKWPGLILTGVLGAVRIVRLQFVRR